MNWIESLEDLYEFISMVVVYAPNDFPKEDFLSDQEQLDLKKAFEELNRGMTFVAKKIPDPNKQHKLQELLDASLAAYRDGDNVKGAHLLQDFEVEVFG